MVKHLTSQALLWLNTDRNSENLLYWTGTGSALSWAFLHQVSNLCKEVMPILSVTATSLYILKLIYDGYKNRNSTNPPK